MVELKQESNFVENLKFWQITNFNLVFHASTLLASYRRILGETNDVWIPHWGHRLLSLPCSSHSYFFFQSFWFIAPENNS
jgi:hypothetical protein